MEKAFRRRFTDNYDFLTSKKNIVSYIAFMLEKRFFSKVKLDQHSKGK